MLLVFDKCRNATEKEPDLRLLYENFNFWEENKKSIPLILRDNILKLKTWFHGDPKKNQTKMLA
jgi:hypothetical protein